MQNKKWLVGLIVLVIIVAAGVWGFSKISHQNKTNEENKAISGVTSENYFDENAKVMLFYSDQCSWCVKEKDVLAKLNVENTEGYRVKPMNVGNDQSLWETYKVNGTPTFIAENGDRLEGYQTEDKLKPWLDQHK